MFAHEPQPPRGEWRLRAEHQWEFDLSGYIHLPGLLSPEDTDRCREACASDPPGPAAWELAEEPALRAKIKQLFGEEQVLQASLALVGLNPLNMRPSLTTKDVVQAAGHLLEQ